MVKGFNVVHEKPRNAGTDLKRSASILETAISAATAFLWWSVSMLSMTDNAYDNRYCFDEDWFESETNGFCNSHSFFCGTSQCCSWQPKPRIIGTDLKRSASNLKPTVSAATIFLIVKRLSVVRDRQNHPFLLVEVSMLSMTAIANDHWYSSEEACFRYETNGCCTNPFLSWSVSMLSMTTKAYDDLNWFQRVGF